MGDRKGKESLTRIILFRSILSSHQHRQTKNRFRFAKSGQKLSQLRSEWEGERDGQKSSNILYSVLLPTTHHIAKCMRVPVVRMRTARPPRHSSYTCAFWRSKKKISSKDFLVSSSKILITWFICEKINKFVYRFVLSLFVAFGSKIAITIVSCNKKKSVRKWKAVIVD